MNSADEWWMELPVSPEYLVSSHGRLFRTSTRRFIAPQRLPDRRTGLVRYVWYITLPDGRRRMVACASAVLEGHYEPRPGPNWEPFYMDGDRSNFHVDNLDWAPHSTMRQLREMTALGNASPRRRRSRRSQSD